jgi:hypothetical protein
MLTWLRQKDAPPPDMVDEDCVEPKFTPDHWHAPASPDPDAEFLYPPQAHSVLVANRATQTQPAHIPAAHTTAVATGSRAPGTSYRFDDTLIISEDEELTTAPSMPEGGAQAADAPRSGKIGDA